METIQNQTLRKECLPIDGKAFVNCLLVECGLEYSGGPVTFEKTVCRSCLNVFFGPARATVHFPQAVGMVSHEPAQGAEITNRVH